MWRRTALSHVFVHFFSQHDLEENSLALVIPVQIWLKFKSHRRVLRTNKPRCVHFNKRNVSPKQWLAYISYILRVRFSPSGATFFVRTPRNIQEDNVMVAIRVAFILVKHALAAAFSRVFTRRHRTLVIIMQLKAFFACAPIFLACGLSGVSSAGNVTD